MKVLELRRVEMRLLGAIDARVDAQRLEEAEVARRLATAEPQAGQDLRDRASQRRVDEAWHTGVPWRGRLYTWSRVLSAETL